LASLHKSGVRDIREHLIREDSIREAARDAEIARIASEKAAFDAEAFRLAARQTVTQLFEKWMTTVVSQRKDGGAAMRRLFKKDILPALGNLIAAEVKKFHILEITDAMVARGVNRMAKEAFSAMRQMFSFAFDRDLIERNPTATLKKTKIGGPDVERERVLNDDEIRELVKKLPDSGLLETTELAIWIALATCCRIGELLAARWEHLNLDTGTWFIPIATAKNKQSHTIFLSPFALAHFENWKRLAAPRAGVIPTRIILGPYA
jgi:integrase